MFNICYRIVGEQDMAEDVLQEGFISAFQNINGFQGRASFGAWLKKIVVNKAIAHLRRGHLEFVALDEQQDVPDQGYFDDEDLILRVQSIRDAIQKLPNGFRVVFSLYLLEGYDHKEIGEILNISESTSKSQYNRAKKKLKEILNKEVYNE